MTIIKLSSALWLLIFGVVYFVWWFNAPGERIIFNPATDGPIKIEKRISTYSMPSGGPEACITSITVGVGSASPPVYIACSVPTSSTWISITTGER